MRVSIAWLSELVELPKGITAFELAAKITSAGLEVEAVEDLSAQTKGVVVARVAKFVPHPNADKLRVVTIEAGSSPIQVVCGASNFVEGDYVALAPPGTVLPGGQKIEATTIRGVESAGMLCSERELGLSTKHEGIIRFTADELQVGVGAPVARALSRDDVVLVVGVTPNRADALSHLGVAREVAAVLRTRLKAAAPTCAERGGPVDALAAVTIEDVEGCPRYACRVIEGLTIGDSPGWLQARLAAVGVRSVNNVVDVTNYVMMERGIPLHAFDHEKLAKAVQNRAQIIVRKAKPAEILRTLDGKERILVEDDVVIADPEKPIALAGVMGGAETEVAPTTTRVLLECAAFHPGRVRKTARRLGLHSEASHRFERGTDPNGVQQAIDRAASLIAELGGGRVCRGVVDAYPKKIQPAVVKFRPKRAAALTGLPPKSVDEGAATKLLLSLGLEVEGRDGEGVRFRVPTYRPDLTREVDLIEEVLRLVGYDAVPLTLPSRAGESASLFDARKHKVVEDARRALEAAGFDEAVNLAFVSPSKLEPFDGGDDARRIRIQNPLGEELSVMRRSLLPALVENAALNHRRGNLDVRLYEHATVFVARNQQGRAPRVDDVDGPPGGDAWAIERPRLAGVATGAAGARGFDRKPQAIDFFDVKGALEEMLASLGLPVGLYGAATTFRPAPDGYAFLHPGRRAAIGVTRGPGVVEIGVVGELHPDVVDRAGLKSRAVVFELDVDALASVVPDVPRAKALPRFPAVRRDFALVLDEDVPAADLSAALADVEAARPLLEDVEIFDVYQGKGIPAGKRSVAVSVLLRATDRTLTDDEVQAVAKALLDDARARFGAEVRA